MEGERATSGWGRPNVLILYTDQQRWDALGCAGNDHIHTPCLDALAARGACFARAYCNSPVCMPSRQSMLSGLYPSAVGTTCNGIEMPPDVPTVWQFLQPYGSTAANLGKLHFLNHSTRDHRRPHPTYGLDRLVVSDEPGCYEDAYIAWVRERDPSQVKSCRCSTPPAWRGEPIRAHPRGTTTPYVFEGPEELTHTAFVADETIRFLEERRGGPFFAIAGFYAPHAPINPPRRFVDLYDPARMPLPVRNEGEGADGPSDDEWRRIVAHYYALVSHVDDQVGRILDALDRLGHRDDTLVLFTSDHGEHLGDHGLVAKGPPGLDSCARVPLVVSYPSGLTRAGWLCDEPVEAVDIVPTILDYCGVQIPPTLQGTSLRALLEGRGSRPRESAYIEHAVPGGVGWKTVATRRLKYCLSSEGRELLYDLERDPHELRDLAADEGSAELKHAAREELLGRWFDVERRPPSRTAQY